MTLAAAAAETEIRNPTGSLYGWRQIFRRFRRNRLALFAFFLLALLCALSAAAGLVEARMGLDANEVDLMKRFLPPSAEHWLGTDALGRDIFLRLLYGGRVSLSVGLVTALLVAVIGTVIGLLAGFYGGRLDTVLMRLTDGVIILPLLPFLIILSSIDLTKLGFDPEKIFSSGVGVAHIVFVIAIFGWTTVARLVRAQVYVVKEQDYIRAARALGVGPFAVMTRHILPNVVAVMIVATTLSVGNIILLESVLSFLGLGIQPPAASWGNMLTGAQELVWEHPFLTLYPGGMIFITVMAFNIFGDGLQDALNPKTKF
ncbi:MAG: ABC transporter permease [Micavibrio sp.]|nr:MAG: ABC transporter permease [Micavibrio sp.]